MSYKITFKTITKVIAFYSHLWYNPLVVTLSLAFHLPNTQIMIFHIPAVSPGIFKNGYWEKAR